MKKSMTRRFVAVPFSIIFYYVFIIIIIREIIRKSCGILKQLLYYIGYYTSAQQKMNQ